MKRRAAAVCGVALVATLAAACQSDPPQPTVDPTGTVKNPVAINFLAYGADEEVAAMQSTVDAFNKDNPKIEVTLQSVANEDQVLARLQGKKKPDVFLLSQRDLAAVAEQELNEPIDELLDSRGVDFGDYYKRDSVQAFSVDNRLQCMPYGVSPMVIYYNTNLIDWDAMRDQDLNAPDSHLRWSFDQFAAAAEFAAQRRGVKGVYIEPSLEGLAPFVYSGGGELFDDRRDPTTLSLSEESSREALARTLDLLRTDKLTLVPRQLRRSSALERFKRGKLGMIAGYRNLVPELRKTPSLDFDVMPMPILEDETTYGDVSGLCMSGDPKSVSAAADFIVHMISAESVTEVAEAGYLVPSNNQVAEDEAFLQTDQLPAHASVFNQSVRDIVLPPLLDSWQGLEDAVHDDIYALFYDRVLGDLEEITAAMDAASVPILDPVEDEESTDGASDGASADGGDDDADEQTD